MKSPVLCLCNFGLVRSRTMSNRLQARGIAAAAAGMCNTRPVQLHALMQDAGTVLVCNKPNVEEDFAKERLKPEHVAAIKQVLSWHQDKLVVVETIGRDKWARENHPDLVRICDAWLDEK